ncbi:MAG: HIT domain-containing protein [Candidatus Omnitrophica bacterium]|nr:HIT domain-containing protein [Candidatus Omnitrophota bacterium]
MDRLWAPWRKVYIRPESKKRRGCLFCGILKAKRDSKNYILKKTRHSFALLNLYPYNNGHTLILPRRHAADLCEMSGEEKMDLLTLCEELQEAIRSSMRAHGFNIGLNLGAFAGAGIPEHLHLHIVPRWKGDANFMPIVGRTKVISESLSSVYRELTQALRLRSRKI